MATEITMLRNPSSSFGCPLKEGETGLVDDQLAKELIELSLAERVVTPEIIKAVPELPSIVGVEPAQAPAESATEQPRKRR